MPTLIDRKFFELSIEFESSDDVMENLILHFFIRRTESRRECLDLQSFVIQTPDFYRKQRNRPPTKPSHYPVALVPGQYQDYYRKYSPAELL